MRWFESRKLCPILRKQIQNGMVRKEKKFFSLSSRMIQRKRKVIIQLDKTRIMSSSRDKKSLSNEIKCKVNACLPSIESFIAKVTDDELKRLVEDGRVKKIWADREVKALTDKAMPVVNAPNVWKFGYKGKGVGIAVLDTGIYPHTDLVQPHNRITVFKDFTPRGIILPCRSKIPYDDNGHGTHCAGDAAGNGTLSQGKYQGTAPEADIIAIRVLNRMGTGSDSQILQGIQWAIDHRERYHIRILSLSLGVETDSSWRDDVMCLAVDAAWKQGLAVFAAAGNSGPKGGTVSSPGITPAVITVGASNDNSSVDPKCSTVADFSSRGPTIDSLHKPDLLAPGVNITSLLSPGSNLDQQLPSRKVGLDYLSLDGTSMATPICAGAAALLLEADPGLQPDELKDILVSTCTDLKADLNAQGAGLLNIAKALKKTVS